MYWLLTMVPTGACYLAKTIHFIAVPFSGRDMKLLHTSITVKNMDESIAFYTGVLGMSLVSRSEIKETNAEITFLKLDGTNHMIELTWWRGKTDYAEGDQL